MARTSVASITRSIVTCIAAAALVAAGSTLAAAPAAASVAPTVVVGAPTGAGVVDGVVTGDAPVSVPVALSGFESAADLVAVVSVPEGGGAVAIDQLGIGASIQREYGYSQWSGVLSVAFHGNAADVTAALAERVRWTAPMSATPSSLTVSVSQYAAGTFYNPANRHYYKSVSTSSAINATAAMTASASTSLFGMTGYLATITSNSENNFIGSYVNAQNVWIGASDAAAEGTWKWVTGPEAGSVFWQGAAAGSRAADAYASWQSGEPNDTNNEDYAGTNYNGVRGKWNDFKDSQPLQSYLVEYGGLAGETSTALAAVGSRALSATAPISVGTLDSASVFVPGTLAVAAGSGSQPVAVELQRFGSPSGSFTATLRIPADAGTLSVSPATGLTLAYGYTGFTGQAAIGFTGSFADVKNALRTRVKWTPPASATTLDLSVSLAEQAAGAFFNPGNGHYYMPKTAGNTSWNSAKTAASSTTLAGMTGYLATITTQSENEFTAKYINASNLWIGASDRNSEINQVAEAQYTQQSASEGRWYWVTGPEAGSQFWQGAANGKTVSGLFANWNTNEPNNSTRCTASHQAGNWISGYYTVCDNTTDGEHYAGTNFNNQPGRWNDFDVDNGVSAWLVEFGGMPNEVSTLKSALGSGRLIAGTAPSAVQAPTAVAADSSATVRWSAPSSDGLSSITGYTVTATPGGATCQSTSDSCTVTGLAVGTQYTFSVVATNSIGASQPSGPSNTVTPIVVTPPATPPTGSAGGGPVLVPIEVGQTDVPVAIESDLSGSGAASSSLTLPEAGGTFQVDESRLMGAVAVLSSDGAVLTLTGTADQVAAALAGAVVWVRPDGTHATSIDFTVDAEGSVDVVATGEPSQPVSLPTRISGSEETTAVVTLPAGTGTLDLAQGYGGTQVSIDASGTVVTVTGSADEVADALGNGIVWTPAVPTDPAPVAVGWSFGSGGTREVTVEEVTGVPEGPASTELSIPEGSGTLMAATADLPAGVTASVSSDGLTLTLTGSAEGIADALSKAVRWVPPIDSIQDSITVELTGGDGYETTFEVPVLAVGAPNPPTGVTAVHEGRDVIVSWTAPAFDGGSAVLGYTATLDDVAHTTCSATGTVSTCTIHEVDPADGPFAVAVTARNRGGSSLAATADVTPTMPGAPSDVEALASTGAATVSWSAPEADGGTAIVDYLVTATSSAPGASQGRTCTATAPATSCAVTGLVAGAPFFFSYDFSVIARNALGAGPAASTPASVLISAGRPGPVSDIALRESAGTGQLSWSAPVDDGGAPVLGYTATDAASGLTCTVAAPSTSCSIPGLQTGTAYHFAVTAVNGIGQGTAASAAPIVAGIVDSATAPEPVATGSSTALPITLDSSAFAPGSDVEVALELDGGGIITVPDADSDGHVDGAPGVVVTGNGTASVVLSGPVEQVTEVLAGAVTWTGAGGQGGYLLDVDVTGVEESGAVVHSSVAIPVTVRPTAAPDALAPVPPAAELPNGTGTLVVDGTPRPVTVAPSESGDALVITGSGFSVALTPMGADGLPIGLDEDGRIVVKAGSAVLVEGQGFQPDSTVAFYLFSDPVPLGSLTAGDDGSLDGAVTVPTSTTVGDHVIQLNGLTTSGLVRSVSVGVTVLAADVPPEGPSAEQPTVITLVTGLLAQTGVGVEGWLGGVLVLLLSGVVLLIARRRTSGSLKGR